MSEPDHGLYPSLTSRQPRSTPGKQKIQKTVHVEPHGTKDPKKSSQNTKTYYSLLYHQGPSSSTERQCREWCG